MCSKLFNVYNKARKTKLWAQINNFLINYYFVNKKATKIYLLDVAEANLTFFFINDEAE